MSSWPPEVHGSHSILYPSSTPSWILLAHSGGVLESHHSGAVLQPYASHSSGTVVGISSSRLVSSDSSMPLYWVTCAATAQNADSDTSSSSLHRSIDLSLIQFNAVLHSLVTCAWYLGTTRTWIFRTAPRERLRI
ncbi:hypothetical protein OE88DRAFT_1229560 [Heliocybe sulcata]|uniref:Uncharacterized protein n=1 Tax=Heliocybe sulcata TaxID=5364 RepID=A0A5C3MKR8_9AGAM|nr:hypothetical protein OE88DRAFT_1229560 [Heliocybe sulcata]